MSVFSVQILVRFRHCDPAGIVFYPRYFEMLNDVVEEWFAAIGWSFPDMILRERFGVPLAAVQARFLAPSRMGDVLTAALRVVRIGRTSCGLTVGLAGPDGRDRVWFEPTLVCVNVDSVQPVEWPEPVRAALAPYLA